MAYEYIDELSINDNLKCSICNDPFEEPVTTRCDHTFCYKCIEQWINTNNSCPTCRSRISNIKALTPVKTRLVLNMLDGLSVKCKTCHQTGIQRGNFKDHLKTCPKRNICSCTASDIRCPWIGQNDQLSLHRSQCPYEQIRPVLTEILAENRQLEEKISQIMERYEKKLNKLSNIKQKNTNNEELRVENQRLKEQIDQLNQKYQQLKNEIEIDVRLSSIVRTITFESLLTADKFGSIPNGFAGLNWTNVRYTNEQNARAIRPNKKQERFYIFLRGYSCVAYNDWKNPMIISSTKQNFTLRACEITSVNHSEDISKLNIIGRKDKIPVYTKTITLKRDISQVIEFNSWIDINEIEFFIENIYFILTWIQLA